MINLPQMISSGEKSYRTADVTRMIGPPLAPPGQTGRQPVITAVCLCQDDLPNRRTSHISEYAWRLVFLSLER